MVQNIGLSTILIIFYS